MGFFEELFSSSEEAQAERARAQMMGESVNQRLHELFTTADTDTLQILQIIMVLITQNPQDGYFLLGRLHATIMTRGMCVSCLEILPRCKCS